MRAQAGDGPGLHQPLGTGPEVKRVLRRNPCGPLCQRTEQRQQDATSVAHRAPHTTHRDLGRPGASERAANGASWACVLPDLTGDPVAFADVRDIDTDKHIAALDGKAVVEEVPYRCERR